MEGGSERLVLVLSGRLEKDTLSGFCERVRRAIEETGARVCVCDVAAVHPDAVAMDLLGRLRTQVLGAGCTFYVRGLPAELGGLLELCGLDDVLGPGPG